MDSMHFLRSLEAQGVYEALQHDIAEALDVEVSAVEVSSGAQHQRLQDHADSEASDNTRLKIDQPEDLV